MIQYSIVYKVYNNLLKKNFNPDIIHSNVIFPAGILGTWLAGNTILPHVITEHWSRLSSFMKKPVLRVFAKKAFQEASAIMPVSDFLAESIKLNIPYLNSKCFFVIGNVVNPEVFKFKEKSSEQNIIRFCAIATWNNKKTPDKLPLLFIKALAEVQKEISRKIELIMVGGGDLIPELKNLCKYQNLDTKFTGYIPKSEIVKELHKTDFLIHASTIETFGVGIAEALTTGTPVICSNVGALPELIDDSNGILCTNDIEAWKFGIHKIISMQYNHVQISKNAKEKFSNQVIGNKIDLVYKSVIKSK